MPKTRRAFWKAKLARNVARDREVTRALRKADWRVVRVWQHEIRRDFSRCIQPILDSLEAR